MNLDSLKEQLKEQWQHLYSQIEENSTFQTLREKYETLSPRQQKTILSSIALVVMLILFSIPLNSFFSSTETIKDFEDNKELSQKLLEIQKHKRTGATRLGQVNITGTRQRVLRMVQNFQLLPEQIGDIENADPSTPSLAKPPIKEETLAIQLLTLNLNQINTIAYRLQNLASTLKLTGLQMKESVNNPDYFDVTYTLSLYTLPASPTPKEQEPTRKIKRRRRNK